MAFVKNSVAVDNFEIPDTYEGLIKAYQENHDYDHLSMLVEHLSSSKEGRLFLVDELKDHDTAKNLSAFIASQLSRLSSKDAPIEAIMELLKLKNAYVRNLGISMLQDFGEAIKYYIVKYLIGDDKDLRIFAVNVLGDVNFPESREMLVELLEHEADVNVAMTAVDYMAEIGQPEDIALLERVKTQFTDEPYVQFAIDRAIAQIKGV